MARAALLSAHHATAVRAVRPLNVLPGLPHLPSRQPRHTVLCTRHGVIQETSQDIASKVSQTEDGTENHGSPVHDSNAKSPSPSPKNDPVYDSIVVEPEVLVDDFARSLPGHSTPPKRKQKTIDLVSATDANSYTVDGMPATRTVGDSYDATSNESSPAKLTNGNGGGNDDGQALGSERVDPFALVLMKPPKPKSRSKRNQKVLKVVIKTMTRIVDALYQMPGLMITHQQVLVVVLAVGWYILGSTLISQAATKLATFSPETLPPPGFELVRAVSAVAQSLSDTIMERFAYLFQGWTYAGLIAKILSVMAVAVPVVLTLGTTYHKVTGVPWEKALLKIHGIVHRQPGANAVSETTIAGFLLVNVSFFTGMFLVAVLFGLVSDEVKRSFRIIRDGNFPMRTQGHILILNYNQYVVPLLRQLWYGKKFSEDTFFNRPVVILADKNKLDMDEEIASRLKIQSLEVYTRTGNPATTRDLSMVAASAADTVIVLHPDTASSQEVAEACKAAVAMALSVAAKDVDHNVVMQMPNELPATYDFMRSYMKTEALTTKQPQLPAIAESGALAGAARMMLQGKQPANVQVLQMPDGNFMDRFMCHAALQPGVFRVWLRILQQGPANVKLRVKTVPASMTGKTFNDIRRSYRDCIVVGIQKGSEAIFDPADTQIVQACDKLIMLSYVVNPVAQPETATVYRAAAKAASERMARQANYQVAPRKVIVAGWNHKELPDMLDSFADAAPENSQVTFILQTVPEDPSPPNRVGNVRFSYVQSDHPTCLKALTEAGIKTADAVMLGVHEELGSVESDAMVLAGLLQVQDAVLSSGRTTAPHVVAKVQRYGTLQVINQYFASLIPAEQPAKCNTTQHKPRAGLAIALPSSSAMQRPPMNFETFSTIPKDVQEQAEQILISCQPAAPQPVQTTGKPAGNTAVAAANVSTSTAGATTGSSDNGGVGNASVTKKDEKVQATAAVAANAAPLLTNSAPPPTPVVSTFLQNPFRQFLVSNWDATFALATHAMPLSDLSSSLEQASSKGGKPAAGVVPPATACKPNQAAQPTSSNTHNAAGSCITSSQGNMPAPHQVHQDLTVDSALLPNPLTLAVNAFVKPSIPQPDAGSSAMSNSATVQMQGSSTPAGNPAASASQSTATTGSHPTPSSNTTSTSTTTSTTHSQQTVTTTNTSNSNNTSTTPASSSGSSSFWSGSSNSNSTSASQKKPCGPPVIKNPEVFLSDDISAALLTLVSAHPDVTLLIRQLLTTRQGAELYLRSPTLFNLQLGERVSFAEVTECARMLKQTAIGYLKADGSIMLVPEPEHIFTYQEGDQVVVFADDFKIKRSGGWGR